MTHEIRVLLVGEHEDVTALASTWTDANSSLTVDREPSPFGALKRLGDEEFDCVVSGSDVEEMSGLEFSARVGRDHPDLPLVVLTDDEEGATVTAETLAGRIRDVSRIDNGDAPTAVADQVTSAVERSRRIGEAETVAARSQRLAERTHDAIVAVDEDDVVDYASPSVERIFGYGPSELVGQPFTTLIADRLEEQYRTAVSQYLRTGAVELDWQSLQVPGKHRDGRDIPLMLSIVESETEAGQLTVIIRDLSKQAHLETELETQLDRMGDGFFALDTDFNVTYANEQAKGLLGREGRDFIDENLWDLFPEAVDTVFEEEYRRALETQEQTTFEAYFEPLETWFSVRAYPSSTGLSVYYQDVTEEKERERALERRQSRLEVVAELSSVIGRLNEALVDVSGRDEIERLVCDQLVESDHIVAAWQGRPPTRGTGVNPTAWAGIDLGTIRGLHPDEDGSPTEALTDAALQDSTVQVGTRDGLDGTHEWDDPAIPEAYAAAAAIPLVHKSSTYGVLHVYTDREGLFVDEVVDTLGQLRDVVGNAISAAERKMALMADRSVELELQVRDADEYFLSAAAETGTRLELDGTVAQSDGTYLEYYTATGEDVDTFAERMEDSPRIEKVSTIEQSGDEHLLSMTFTEPKVSELLAQYGGTFRELIVEDGVGTVVAEFPRGADLRGVIGAFETEFASVDLRAKRENKHPSESTSDFRQAFEETLTDRQREAIETAHHAGYFNWPRDADAEEIAEALGISSPTLHEHLRAAQSKLLSGLFDNEGEEN